MRAEGRLLLRTKPSASGPPHQAVGNLVGALVYRLALPLATRWTSLRREQIISAIARS